MVRSTTDQHRYHHRRVVPSLRLMSTAWCIGPTQHLGFMSSVWNRTRLEANLEAMENYPKSMILPHYGIPPTIAPRDADRSIENHIKRLCQKSQKSLCFQWFNFAWPPSTLLHPALFRCQGVSNFSWCLGLHKPKPDHRKLPVPRTSWTRYRVHPVRSKPFRSQQEIGRCRMMSS